MSLLRSTGALPALAVAAVVSTVLVLAACGDSSSDGPPTAAQACAAYCTTLTTNCTATNTQFADATACNTYCVRARTAPEFWSAGIAGATSGNSLACRTYHGGAPAVADPVLHCPHAGPTGANTCGDWCEDYCDLALSLCTGANQIFAARAECTTACAAFATDGANNATAGDSVQCRINHLGLIVAGGPASVHCGHARPVPTGVCVNP
jgi:hypothetical protein